MKWTNDLQQADFYVCFTRWNQDKLTNQGRIVHVVEREHTPLIYIRSLKQAG